MHDKSMSWPQFIKYFIDWTFSDDNIRRRINAALKRNNSELKKPGKNGQSLISGVDTSRYELLFTKSNKRDYSNMCNESCDDETNNHTPRAVAKQALNQSRIRVGNSSNNSSFKPKESLKIDETVKKSDKDKIGEISEEESSSFNLCKKKRYSYFEHGAKSKRINPVNRKLSNNFGLKSAFSTRNISTIIKRRI